MLRYLKETAKLIIAILYFAYLKLTDKKHHRLVIYYHGLNVVGIASFRRQMECLARSFTVVKPSEIITADRDGAKNLVAMTFDDAFVSVMGNVVPILKEYGLPAGIFVPVGNLGQKPDWKIPENYPDKNEVVMSKEQIRQLDKEGLEIFSHTLSHPVLTEIEDDRLKAELVESKQQLREIVNHEIIGISYPHGAYDARVCEATRRAGYKLGFTIEPELINSFTDALRIGRTAVSPDDSLTKFKLKANGAYQATKYLRGIKRMVSRKYR